MSATLLRVDVEKRLAGLDLHARFEAAREILVLFGPSGAGKTTILNAVAGLMRPDAGEIELDGRTLFRAGRPGRVVNVAARHRGVGYVMQDYALFPHMTALENVLYPLRRERNGQARARALLERMSLLHLADVHPARLSGGQQQRLALARALARQPRLLLLDEPFAALDAALRERLQRDLHVMRQDLDLSVVLVTHRLEDAFALGDRLAVVRHGQIAQVGPLEDVFRRPASRGVAEVLGIRNLFRARVAGSGPSTMLDWAGISLEAPATQGVHTGDELTAYIRPEDIKILYPDRPLGPGVTSNVFDARIVSVRSNASARALQVALPNGCEVEIRFPLLSYLPLALEPGATVRVSMRREGVILLGND